MIYLCYTYPQFLIAVYNDPLERFVKYICNTRADIREKAYWVANKIGRAKNAVQLTQHILFVVVCYPTLEFRHGQSHVLDCKSIQFKGSVIDITNCHC